MKKTRIDTKVAYRLINPGCVVLVGVGDGSSDNLFTVAWNMPARKDPPKLALLSGKRHFSYDFIDQTGEFSVNIMDAEQAGALLKCGTVSGRDVPDKFAVSGLTRKAASRIKAPLVEEAAASIECTVDRVIDVDGGALIIANIVAAEASPVHFTDKGWNFDNGLRLLHHLTGANFCTSDNAVRIEPAETG